MYKNSVSYILGKLLPYGAFNEEKGREENISEGFVNGYSRQHFFEDVAEFWRATDCPGHMIEINSNPKKNSRLEKKLALAQRSGLVPKDYMQYIAVERKYRDCISPSSGP